MQRESYTVIETGSLNVVPSLLTNTSKVTAPCCSPVKPASAITGEGGNGQESSIWDIRVALAMAGDSKAMTVAVA